MAKKRQRKAKILKPKHKRIIPTKEDEQEMKSPKSQIISIDTMIATVIFIAAITCLLVYVGSTGSKSKMDELRKESELIPNVIITANKSDLSIMAMNRVDTDRLTELSNKQYEDLRSELGLKYDFCLYFEDNAGNVVNLSQVIAKNEVGIGSPDASISNIPCGIRS